MKWLVAPIGIGCGIATTFWSLMVVFDAALTGNMQCIDAARYKEAYAEVGLLFLGLIGLIILARREIQHLRRTAP